MPYSVIHIGANKTGSTTLQRCLFSKCKSIVYLGEDGPYYKEFSKILNSIVSDDDMYYRREDARKLFKGYFSNDDSSTYLYSNEDIMTSKVPSQCARRLSQLMPDAKILIVIRNQLSAISSWYANHGAYLRNVPRFYWRRYVSFEDWISYCFNFLNQSPIGGFLYKKHADLWASYFGRDNVCILLFEDFVENKKEFVEQLCEILKINNTKALELLIGKKERQRCTIRMHRFHKFYSRYLWGRSIKRVPFGNFIVKVWNSYLSGGQSLDGFMTERWQKKIGEFYAIDNHLLAKEYNLSLEKYRYPIKKI
jgi:hypothetical protein